MKNSAMLKVVAHHLFCICIANMDDFDFPELLMFIFVEKAVDVEQNVRGQSRGLKQVFISLLFFNQKFKNVEKALEVEQNARGHSMGSTKY